MAKAIALPSVLSFTRCINLSPATLVALDGAGAPVPLDVRVHGQRTAKNHELKEKKAGDVSKGSDEVNNLSVGERCRLPDGCTRMQASFSGSIGGIGERPEACNSATDAANMAFLAGFRMALTSAGTEKALRTVGRYIAYNICSASWLWRNRDDAEAISTTIAYGDTSFTLAGVEEMRRFAVVSAEAHLDGIADPADELYGTSEEFAAFADAVADALCGQSRALLFTATAVVERFAGARVFPSQLYSPDDVKFGKSVVRPIFFRTSGPIENKMPTGRDGMPFIANTSVGISEDKLGNALRTYDRFHGDTTELAGEVIAIEPNGGSLRYGHNFRKESQTAHRLLQQFVTAADELTDSQRLFVAGCLVRGGVFSATKEEKGE